MYTRPTTLRRLAASPVLAAAFGVLTLAAQQPSVSPAAPVTMQAALKMPDLAVPADTTTSSSSADAGDAVAAERLTLGEGLQPPPRRRYGRPRYTDSQHNPDGSNKYTFEIGGGLTLPTGGTNNYAKTSYSFQGGAGRNFNKYVAVLAQFDWDNFGIQTATLNNLLATYNRLGATDSNGAALTQLNGSSHIWSFTLDPMYNFTGGEKLGAYVIGGVGFYHKTSTFSIPTVGTAYDPYYGYYQFAANAPIDTYTSNSAGFNAGVGFTYKLSRFANERLFGEARYVYTANQRRPYYDGTTGTSLSATYFNVFPQNSAPTTFIPVKFGLRF